MATASAVPAVPTWPIRPTESFPAGPSDIEYLRRRTDLTPNEKRMQLLVNKATSIVSRSNVGRHLFEKPNSERDRDLLPFATVVVKVIDGFLELEEDALTFIEKK